MTVQEAIEKLKYMPVAMFDNEADLVKRIAIESMEKQIPKNIKVCKTPNTSFGKARTYYVCPNCGVKMCCDWNFCFECGQKIDWEEGGTSD